VRARGRRKASKSPEKCPGDVGFAEDDGRTLEAIKPEQSA
jgi:hypothetical protein